MARYGPPDDPNLPDDEPTQFINYGDYGRPGQPPAEPLPWYRRPVALVSFGAAGAVLIALIVFGLVKLLTGGMTSDNSPTTLTPITRSATSMVAPTTTATATTTEPLTTTTTTTEPTTTTSTTTTTTTTTSTTATSVSTSLSTSTSTSTVTQTVTVPAPGG